VSGAGAGTSGPPATAFGPYAGPAREHDRGTTDTFSGMTRHVPATGRTGRAPEKERGRAMKIIVGTILVGAVALALAAGKDDIRRFYRMHQM
jgi:hypothetical protein